jgi:putative membrane protein
MSEPYARFESDDLILRDELAIDRTLLANERTGLAYARSAVTLALAGVTFIQFGDTRWFQYIGVACLPAAVFVGWFGARRYYAMKARIVRVRANARA